MKHNIIITVLALFLLPSFICSGDDNTKNRKKIPVIVMTTRKVPAIQRSIEYDIKAYICEETESIEIEGSGVKQADICIIDSKNNIIDYLPIEYLDFVQMNLPPKAGTYIIAISTEEIYAEGVFSVE